MRDKSDVKSLVFQIAGLKHRPGLNAEAFPTKNLISMPKPALISK
jgi:hypothetical protein